jgi:hypothetical protein
MSPRRRVTAAAFIAGPALFLADNLLHPKEFEPGNEARQLQEIAGAYERWQIAHLLAFLAILFFAAAILGLASLLYERRPRAALWGGALGLAGAIGFAAVVTLDGFTWGVLGELSARPGVDARTVQLALDEVQNSGWSLPYYLAGLGYIAGLLVLAVGATRARLISRQAGVLLALAAAMTGTETMIVSNTYFVAGAAVMLAAGVAVAHSLRQMEESPAWTSS